MTNDWSQRVEEARTLAARHGLLLTGDIRFNDMGLDFAVGFGTDTRGQRWVLRIPRRDAVQPGIAREAAILDFVRGRIPVEVPDWQVRTPDLVAYPMLPDPMALEFDAHTHQVTWNIDPASEAYVDSLATVLAALHASPAEDAVAAGIRASSATEARASLSRDLERVREELGMGREQEARFRRWLDNDSLWPGFSVLVHGDLYAGHVTAGADGQVSGIIDWTEAEVSDPSIDFAGHLAAFPPESLERLVSAYERAGGRVWPTLLEQIEERNANASAVRYGIFALDTKSDRQLAAAREQLGAG